MDAQTRRPAPGVAARAAVALEAPAERYALRQRETMRETRIDEPRPREFDASGFPVPQRNRPFRDRVARMLRPN